MTDAEFGAMRYPDPALLAHHAPLISLYHRGLTHKQVARELGRTPYGVRSTLRRLRAKGRA